MSWRFHIYPWFILNVVTFTPESCIYLDTTAQSQNSVRFCSTYDICSDQTRIISKSFQIPTQTSTIPRNPGILHVPWSKRPYTVPGVVIQPLLEIDFPFDHCYYHFFLSRIFCSLDINDIIISVYA